MDVSVIVPALNERDTIGPLVEALFNQTIPPAEVVVADGGSTDGTRGILAALAASEPRLRIVAGPGGISENRNAAIAAATSEVIACTDAGCVPDRDWLERVTAPIADGADFVAGVYRPRRNSLVETIAGLVLMPVPEEVDAAHFVPAGGSQAFRKEAWRRVGGFPEGMAAGEDTLFGQRMRQAGYLPVFCPDAVVTWTPPGTVRDLLVKGYRWGRADGLAGTLPRTYAKAALTYWGPAALGLGSVVVRRRRLAALGAAALAAIGLVRTRTRRRAAPSALTGGLVAGAHVAELQAQSLGWAVGFTRRNGLRGLAGYGRKYLSLVLRQGEGATMPGRTNVDVVVTTQSEAERWTAITPDTWRAFVVPDPLPLLEAEGIEVHPPTGAESDWWSRALRVSGAEIAVRGRIVTGIGEPAVKPCAVAALPEVWSSLGTRDPATAALLARQAGLRLAVVPTDCAPLARPIDATGVAVVLGVVPLHDVGGGSRGAQMTQELLARGFHVLHLHRFEVDETVDLGLRFVHEHLEEGRVEDLDVDALLARLPVDGPRLALAEIPHPDFLGPLRRLQGAGFRVVYDLMDDWSDSALGGWGYARTAEEELVAFADGLVASAPSLVRRLEAMTTRTVIEVPNAVNTRLFGPASWDRPADLPSGDGPVFEYHGSLYGDWFDWGALRRVAERFPSALLVVIGDEKGHQPMPANVHFLGLKPQHRLPAYLAHTDVALIPFVVSPTTHAVSPLKVFEYLAMGVPVASTPLDPLADLDGVHTDGDLERAVEAALAAPRPDPEKARALHGWDRRLDALLAAAGLDRVADPTAVPVRVLERLPTRYSRAERLVLA